MTIEQKIQKFKLDLLRKMPFYGDIAMQLLFEPSSTVATAATDGTKIFYNPDFMASLDTGEMHFILMHEIMHMLLLHCPRSKDKDPRLWNVASDFIVNDILTGGGMEYSMQRAGMDFKKPSEGLYAELPAGATVENLYGKILEDNRARLKNGRLNGQILDIRRNYGESIEEVFRRWSKEPEKNRVTISLPGDGSGGQGSDLLPSQLTEAERQKLENDLRQIVTKAIAGAKGRSEFGNFFVPDALYKLTETKKLNWRSLFKGMLSEIESDETSYATPERKYLHMDMILPGHGEKSEMLENVWAFVDCSGSVGKDETEQFLTQLYRILKEFRCTMQLAYWDTAVADVYRDIDSEKKLLECLPHHSGGTDINCIYTWLREKHIRPDCMLVLTDGYFGNLKPENGRYRSKTIVVLSENSAAVDDNICRVGKIASL